MPPASYKLTYKSKSGRGVYSFCMCPGGFVVNAKSENDGICVNGMSNYKRDTKYANSAIVVTVGPNDYGVNILDGMYFQEMIEKEHIRFVMDWYLFKVMKIIKIMLFLKILI